MKNLILGISVFILDVSCSKKPSNERSQTGNKEKKYANIPQHIQKLDSLKTFSLDRGERNVIRFKREAVFTDSLGIGTMGHVAVDSKGRVFISEGGFRSSRQTIHVYDSKGNYLKNMGRAGAGPGEFQILSDIQISSGSLYAYDYRLQRINVFSLQSLSSSATIPLNPQSWQNIDALEGSRLDQSRYFIRNGHTFLFGFTEPLTPDNANDRYRRYYLLNEEGDIASDQIYKEKNVNFHQGTGIPGPQLTTYPVVPSDRHSIIAVSDGGSIYSSWTEQFLIKKYSPDGEYQKALYYPYENSQLNKSHILDPYQDASPRLRQSIENLELPETWPALHYMLLDDEERLWVCTITDDSKRYQWWVLDSNGKPLGTFKWPGRRLDRAGEERKIKVIKDGKLYAWEQNEKGYEQIVKYNFVIE